MSTMKPSHRIARDLREQIARGDYRPGQQLPSGTALMERYGVARQTVQNAIDQLRQEGLVTSRSGAGVFVRENGLREVTRTQALQDGAPHVVETVASRFATTADTHGTDGIAPGEVVFDITRTTYDQLGTRQESERIVLPANGCQLVYEIPSG